MKEEMKREEEKGKGGKRGSRKREGERGRGKEEGEGNGMRGMV
jgi:hypothetical protein